MCEFCYNYDADAEDDEFTRDFYAEADRLVRAGIEYLDKTVPQWRRLVDVERLDIESTDDCVLGQVYAEYAENELFKFFSHYYNYEQTFRSGYDYWTRRVGSDELAKELGFAGTYGSDGVGHEYLTVAWKDALS